MLHMLMCSLVEFVLLKNQNIVENNRTTQVSRDENDPCAIICVNTIGVNETM